jgi:hypothetical protein
LAKLLVFYFLEPQPHCVSASKTSHSSRNSVLVLFVLASSLIACRAGAFMARSSCYTRSRQPRELMYQLLRRIVSRWLLSGREHQLSFPIELSSVSTKRLGFKPLIIYEYQFHHATNKSEANRLERTRNTQLIQSSQVATDKGEEILREKEKENNDQASENLS